MSGHTPGPWIVDGNAICPAHAMDTEICEMQPIDKGGVTGWFNGPVTSKNVSLVAAAPDLFDALATLLDCHANNTLFSGNGQWEWARAAFDKACGVS